MTNGFVRVPPDSTGKRLQTLEHTVNAVAVNTQVMHLGDSVNPEFMQHVDARGQASVRFAEGSPSMDAFGNLRTTNATVLGAYEYTAGSTSDLFSDVLAGGGTITHQPTKSELHLSVDDISASEASRTSNRYHYYQPGVGNLIIITLSHSDAGKANNYREWGYADERNGLLFRLENGTFKVVTRSDTTGSVVEQAVVQSSFNGDKLDGTGLSGMTLDVTKANFYWIDFAWLGVGAVRFGVLAPDGSRVVCHTFNNPNNNLGAYMATGSLPLHFHNANTGATSGPSVLKLVCAAVYAESSVDYTYWRFADADSGVLRTVTTDTPLVSIRPAYTYQGRVNRVGIYPECLSVIVRGGAIKLTIVDDATVNGNWNAGVETAEINTNATTATGGEVFHTYYLDAGTHHIDLAKIYEANDEGYHTLANATAAGDCYTLSLVATKMDGTTVTAAATLNYRELR